MKLRTSTLVGLLSAVVATAAVGASVAPGGIVQGWDRHYTDNAYVRGDVTQISPKVSGHVTEVVVRDNQPVRAGDVLFRIDDRDFRARLAQAEAALSARKASEGNLDAQLNLQRAAIGQAEAALREASAEQGRAQRDATRAGQLAGEQLIAASQFDQLSSSANVASARVDEMRAALMAAHQRAAVLESQRPQLLADIDAARAAVALAALDVDSTVVRAPLDGRVSERAARTGQYVKAGTPLIGLVPPELWVVANFKETQLEGMRAGASVDIAIDAVPGVKFHGRLESLSPASGAQFALLPPDNATGNFTRIVQRVPVRIALVDEPARLAELRPGMSATARVQE
ncbi:HlyD family secretion protein [Lysobacter sp. S4-A87]|uniref:HlyD family secretion protein n=1 Tax=Lysobacter sp. S4-A87 TaxID=2925843 RepID=UPI001F53AE64|nr:HlyD family secretion protein [Lysobacter sp. S4-A87]UNK50147.1 HlyD family secretion protein [Lysobacter sp. S4-A87]